MELGNKFFVCFVVIIGLSSLSFSVQAACELADIKSTWTYITAIKKFEVESKNNCNCEAKNVVIRCLEGYIEKEGRLSKDFNVGGVIKAGEIVRGTIDDPFPGGVLHFEVKTIAGEFLNCK